MKKKDEINFMTKSKLNHNKTNNMVRVTSDRFRLSHAMNKPVFGVSDQVQHKLGCGCVVAWWLMPRTPDPEVGGSSSTRVKPCCVLEQGIFTPQKYW